MVDAAVDAEVDMVEYTKETTISGATIRGIRIEMIMEMVFKRGAIFECDISVVMSVDGFHCACKRDTGTFALPAEYNYWKLPRKTVGAANGTGTSEGSGVGTQSQRRSDLSEVILRHQVEATDATFSSFLTDFSKVLDNLK